MLTLIEMIRKEFLQLRQDSKMIPAMVVGPLIQLLALGYAANMDITNIPILVVDQDRSAASRRLVERFQASEYFELVGAEEVAQAADAWLVEGRAQLALVIGPGFGADVLSGRRPRVQIVADGADSNSAGVGLGHATRLLNQMGVEGRPSPQTARPGMVELRPRVLYNPDLKSRWFYVPAVLAMVLMLVAMMMPSMAVVREKEIGTLEQISVTPLRPWQLIVGKLTPFVVIGILDMLLVTLVSRVVFRVPMRGSLLLLTALTLLYILSTLGLGLLVSTLVNTQQQAMMFSAFVLMVPMIYLSGLIFPIENMPRGFQIVSYAIPVRYYANILRGVFLRGSGLDVLWPDALALLGIGTGVLALAVSRFRKSLD